MPTKSEQRSLLELFTLEEAEKKLPVSASEPVESSTSDHLKDQANMLIDQLFSVSSDDISAKQDYAREVLKLGSTVQQKLVHKSNLLREPMSVLMNDLQDGGSIAQDMINLQHQINQINPNRFNFKMSGFRRLLSKLPGIGTVLSNWLIRFETVQGVINDIVESLKVGRKRLGRDNITLEEDKSEMFSLAMQLEQYVKYGQVLDAELTSRIENEVDNEERKTFLQKDVLFPLRQRIIDLQQQQAVNQHGMITSEAIIQNNKELIRGVDRSLNVTVVAFQTASTLSVALEHQKKVLKGVQAINETTNDLLLSTSEKLKDQGAEIQQQSMSASIDIETLKQAFENVDSALKEVNSFRIEALPRLSESIQEMDKMNIEMGKSIEQLQRSSDVANKLEADL